MAYFPLNERIFAVEAFIQTQSIVQTQRQFRREFDIPRHGRIPKRDTILNWVSHFRVYGTLPQGLKDRLVQ